MALGCAGMSADDFCRCTPSEFDEVMKAWHAREERRERMGWEQVRTVCLFALQPLQQEAPRGEGYNALCVGRGRGETGGPEPRGR